MVTMKEKAHYNKTHYCRCQTKAIATVYREMGQEKKDIVEEMGFGGLTHVPEMNVFDTLLIELLDRFDVESGCLKTLQGTIYITPRKVAAALGITNGAESSRKIFDSVKNISLATLTKNVLDMSVEGEENQKKFKRTFVVFIQKCFLLPTTVNVASPIHKPPIFHIDIIREWDCAKYVLNFLMKGVEIKREGKKQSVDGCVFVLMLIYFQETKFPRPFIPEAPPAPWVAYWTREMIIERMSSETTQPLTQGSSTPSVDAVSNTRKNTPEIPVKYYRKKKIFPRKKSKTPRVATPESEVEIVEIQQQIHSEPLEIPPLALSLPSSVQEELMKDDFIYVPPQEETQQTSNNDCPQEPKKNGVTGSITSSVIEDLLKDDYVYEVSNEACRPKPNKQGVTGSITSSVLKEFFKDADVYEVSDDEQSQETPVARQTEKETLILSSFDSAAQTKERKDERPSFSLGISPPASQPTQPFQESNSQLKILAEVVVDAGVAAALNFAKGTSSELTLTVAEVYKTS
ncbi:uncharacterized protein DS421_15g500470 [Arachis hypogaea]|nr:uncharacterized protein DS421_15g500470 [Arachis hypogaea]